MVIQLTAAPRVFSRTFEVELAKIPNGTDYGCGQYFSLMSRFRSGSRLESLGEKLVIVVKADGGSVNVFAPYKSKFRTLITEQTTPTAEITLGGVRSSKPLTHEDKVNIMVRTPNLVRSVVVKMNIGTYQTARDCLPPLTP